MLATLLNRVMPRDYLTDGMRGLLDDVQVVAALARQTLPRLLAALDAAGVALDGFLARWLPSLYLGSVSQHVADRIFDLVTYKGFTALFRITLGLLSALADEIDELDARGRSAAPGDSDGAPPAGAGGGNKEEDDGGDEDDMAARADAAAAAASSTSPSDGTPCAEPHRSSGDTDDDDDDDDGAGCSRTGTILALLQSLPERITEAELIARTYAVHIPSREKIDEMRRAAWAQFDHDTPAAPAAAAAAAPAPAPPSLAPPSPSSPAQHRPPAPALVLPTNITIIPQSAEPLRCPGLQLGGPPSPAMP